MTPGQWAEALAPEVPWQKAYPIVAEQARLHISHNVLVGEECSTSELVEALFPERLARGESITARKRIFKALTALAPRGLKDYCHKGEPMRAGMMKGARPWRWQPPAVVEKPAEPMDDLANQRIAELCQMVNVLAGFRKVRAEDYQV